MKRTTGKVTLQPNGPESFSERFSRGPFRIRFDNKAWGARRTRLAPMSKRRKKESVVYAKKRREFLDANPTCAVCLRQPSTQLHHVRGRGKHYLDEAHFMATCNFCHEWIHRNPILAFAMGYREKA